MSDPNQSFLTTLHGLLTSYFDQEELRTLSFDLGIDYDDLRGEGRASKARELIMLMARRQRLFELVELARKYRPNANWPSVPEHFALSNTTPPPSEIQHFEPETIYILLGPFLMGSQEGKGIPTCETPQHEVYLPAYRIGKYPVTNEQYAEFIRQSGHMVAPQSGWEGQIPPDDKLKHPVMGVTWYDARAYCEWLSEQSGRQYGLPSEAQWEKAARGTDGRIYPWGDEWDSSRCNHGSGQTTPVDAYPAQTVYGCYDMVGNVREWTSTLWGEKPRQPKFRYPWAQDQREDLTASRYVLRVYRGGAATDDVEKLRCSARSAYFPDRAGPPRKRHGFRVVLRI